MPVDSTITDAWANRNCLVAVAHPDDETLWSGGTILLHPKAFWDIITLCRKSDTDRAPKFHEVSKIFDARTYMGDMDDGPEQIPLDNLDVQHEILTLLPQKKYDLIITHNPLGEYTRHKRHEEVALAIYSLWEKGKIETKELWMFAYEDACKRYIPRPIEVADIFYKIPENIFKIKQEIINGVYGFEKDSFEYNTTQSTESFWRFTKPSQIKTRFIQG